MNEAAILPLANLGRKLSPPAAGRHNIRRSSLLPMLRHPDGAQVFLVRAPAGFGKSTLLRQVSAELSASGFSVGWLTLDQSDNDVTRLLSGLQAVLRGIEEQDAGARATPPYFQQSAAQVLARIGQLQTPFAIFLDDVEHLAEPEPARLLRDLIAQLPANGRLYLGSRSLPNLHLGRLRVSGTLVEIGLPDLRFSQAEAEDYVVRKRGVALNPDDLARLYRMTEGWPAGLTLASTAIGRQADTKGLLTHLLGRDQTVTDYFAEEVFARQTEAIQNFLLRTSILRELEPDLCGDVAGTGDAAAILEALSTSDVLMGVLEGTRTAYRYHGLFSEFLRARLEQKFPAAEIAAMHLAAAEGYLRAARPVPAIDHLIEAQAFERAAQMIDAEVDHLLGQGRMRLLARWFTRLPAEVIDTLPELRVARIWATGLAKSPAAALEMLQSSGLHASDAADVSAHVRAMTATFLAMTGRLDEAYDTGKAAVPFLPSPAPFADTLLLNTMSTVTALMGRRQEARRHNENAKRSLAPGADMFNLMYSEAGRGILDLQEGRLREALARLRIAVTEAHPKRRDLTGGNAYSAIPYAAALYETGEIDEAGQILQAYLPMALDLGLTDHLVLGYRTSVRIAEARDEKDIMWSTLVQMEHAGVVRSDARLVGAAQLERLRVLLVEGEGDEAVAEFREAEANALWDHVARMRYLGHESEDIEIARLRLQLFVPPVKEVPRALDVMRRGALRDRRMQRWLKLSILGARNLLALGESGMAEKRLSEAASFARAQGYARIFHEEGAWPGGTPLIVAEFGPVTAAAAKPDAAPVAGAGSQCRKTQDGPLTNKEIEVLHLLSKGLSNISIGRTLDVSDSTVRTHLRNINRKLEAQSRTHAVAIGQSLGLI
jgi:LuxR family transcriptional regulator, maltose regulon positive regulatory protein